MEQCAHWDLGEGEVTLGETEADLPASVGGSPAEVGAGSGSPWGQDTGSGGSGKYSLA